MKKVCTIYLVRHGLSESNKAGLIGGQSDPALTDEGREQAHAAKAGFHAVQFDAAYSSNLQRAIETGDIIYGKPIPKHRQLHDLRERSFGELEAKPAHHLEDLHATLIDLSLEERRHYKHVPGMESDHELSTRFIGALKKIAQDHLGETVLVAAHGSAIRNTLITLGYATPETIPPGSFGNTGYVQLMYDGNNFKVAKVVGVKGKSASGPE